MTALTIVLPPDVYDQLATTAQQQQKSIEVLAREWLTERSVVPEPARSDRERVRAALRAAGLMAEPASEARRNKPLTHADGTALSDRERARAVLIAAGLVVEPSPEARRNKPLTQAERAALAAQVPPGRPLSEIIIEERGEF